MCIFIRREYNTQNTDNFIGNGPDIESTNEIFSRSLNPSRFSLDNLLKKYSILSILGELNYSIVSWREFPGRPEFHIYITCFALSSINDVVSRLEQNKQSIPRFFYEL